MPTPGGSCVGNVWHCGRCLFSDRCHNLTDAERLDRETR